MKHGPKIGEGLFKEVHEHGSDPDKVYAEFREPLLIEDIKSAFYLRKIMHMFFPQNVPEVSLAGNEKDETGKETTYLVAEKVHTDEEHRKSAELNIKRRQVGAPSLTLEESSAEAEYAKKIQENPEVKEFIRKANSLGFIIDSRGLNFSIKDGVVQYMDVNPAWEIEESAQGTKHFYKSFDEDKLRAAIETLPDKDAARHYFNKLVEFAKIHEDPNEVGPGLSF